MAGTAAAGRAIEREVTIQARPERVFAAFTEKAGLESWFVLRAEVDPRPGGRFAFHWTNEHVSGHFVEVDPPRRLVMEWDEEPAVAGITTTTVTLTPVDGGTHLRFVHSGFGEGPDWDALYDGMSSGWVAAFDDLKSWMESGIPNPEGFRHS